MDDTILCGEKAKVLECMPMIRDFCLRDCLILPDIRVKIHPISDGVKFCGYQIRDGHIFAGKRICHGIHQFLDRVERIIEQESLTPVLTDSDQKKIRSRFASRAGGFIVTDFR